MTRKSWKRTLGVVAVVVSGLLVWNQIQGAFDEAEFQRQLRLARAEGLPTNAAEFAATIKPAAPAENAAPLYVRLHPSRNELEKAKNLLTDLTVDPSPTNLARARILLDRTSEPLALLDQATKKPRCWFNRDWAGDWWQPQGVYRDMWAGAFLLALRGEVAENENRAAEAAENNNRVRAIALHAYEEQCSDTYSYGEQVYVAALKQLANWCVRHPAERRYAETLAKAVAAYPKPDARAENRDRLWDTLRFIEIGSSAEGEKKLGLKPGELPSWTFYSLIMSRSKAKVDIVKAERDFWAALLLPTGQRTAPLEDADNRRENALRAFPFFFRMTSYNPDPVNPEREFWRTARQEEFTAILRGTAGGKVAVTLSTGDLKSPFTGDPLSYSWDGKQVKIVTRWTKDGKSFDMKFPSGFDHFGRFKLD